MPRTTARQPAAPGRILRVAALWCSVSCLVSNVAQAQMESIELAWEAPAPCPSQSDVLRSISTMNDASMSSSTHALVVVSLEQPEVWRADITLRDSRGEAKRSLRGESCDALAEAVSVVIAMAVRQAPPAPPEPSKPGPPSESIAPPDVAPTVEPRPRSSQWGFGTSGWVDSGTLPSLAAGLAAIASFRTSGLRIELDGDWLAPRSASTAQVPSEGAEFSLRRVGARGCGRLELRPGVSLGPCAVMGMEWLTGDGFGSDFPERSTSRSVSLGVGGVGQIRMSEASALRVGVDLSIPLVRPTFEVEGTGSVHRAGAAALRVFLGPELLF